MRSPPLPSIQDLSASISCENLLQCFFTLNPLEIKIYRILAKEGPMRVDEIANKINRDRSTAYRCLRRLLTCNICYKEQKYLDKGGYYHLYTAEAPEDVKKKLEQCIANWQDQMTKATEDFLDKFKE